MAITLQSDVTERQLGTSYPGWSSGRSPQNTEGSGETTAPKKSWFSSLLSSVGSVFKNGGYSEKYYGDEPPYNDGTDNNPVGRFVALKPVEKRFRLGNEFGSESTNPIFYTGFEDPTFLTFRVEFGAWGASMLDRQTLAAAELNSNTQNVFFTDYDEFPMGLLGLNYGDAFSASPIPFADTRAYSAVNYLLNRNEDRRAQYAQDFVEGLYTLQKDFQYIFTSINGIDKLDDFDSERGMRLKDCTIKIECNDDTIDQKIRYLMTMYRKAAWDDVWQRWALPDIYRYFKMIIYIFDQRALQMGNGMFSPDQEYFPIAAYECGPCEFQIDSLGPADFTQDYTQGKTHRTELNVKVKNVRTLFANQLFQRVKYVNDIFTKTQHDVVNDVNAQRESGRSVDWRYAWMRRMFMEPDEYTAYATWHNDFASTAKSHYIGDPGDDELSNVTFPPALIDTMYDSTWHQATVTDHGYIIKNFKDLWKSIKEIVTSRTTLIRDSRQSDRYYFVNDLQRLDPTSFEYYIRQNLAEVDIDGVRMDVIRHIAAMKMALKNFMLYGEEQMKQQLVPNPQEENDIPDQNMAFIQETDSPKWKVELELSEEKQPEQQMIPPVFAEDIPSQDLVEPIMNLAKPEQQMIPPIFAEDIPSQDLVKLIMNLAKPKQPFPELTEDGIPDQQLAGLLLDPYKYDLNAASINGEPLPDMPLVHPDLTLPEILMDLANLIVNLEKPHGQLVQIELNLDKLVQKLAQLWLNLAKPHGPLAALLPGEQLPEMKLIQMILNLDMLAQKLAQMDLDLSLPEQKLAFMEMNLGPWL